MAEIVNLRRFKKRKARDQAAESAVQARVKHGRTKAQKTIDSLEIERIRKAHDAHKRPPGAKDPD